MTIFHVLQHPTPFETSDAFYSLPKWVRQEYYNSDSTGPAELREVLNKRKIKSLLLEYDPEVHDV